MAKKNVIKKLPTDHKFQRMLKEMQGTDREEEPPSASLWPSILFFALVAGGFAGVVYLILSHFHII